MALAAADVLVMSEKDQDHIEATHRDLEEIQRHQSARTGKLHNVFFPSDDDDDDDLGESNVSSDTQVDYRYLEWTTPLDQLCDHPENLPKQVTGLTDPFKWSDAHKNVVLTLCCLSTFVAAYTAGAYTSGLNQMMVEWNMGRVPLLVGVTAYTTGFAIAPMFLAPMSEVYGRRNVFMASLVVFNVCNMACALSPNYASIVVTRIFLGFGGSTFSTLCGGVIADIYSADHRGFPMSCFATLALFGTGAGPLVCGFMAERLDWRWIHWHQFIAGMALLLVTVVSLKETRGSVLLIYRARALNTYLDAHEPVGSEGSEKRRRIKVRWRVRAEEERESLVVMVKTSLTRPFYFLFTEPVVFWFSLWVAFSWGILYLFLQGVPLVFKESHNFTVAQTGSVFTAMCVGALLAFAFNTILENSARRYLPHVTAPERRLYSACVLGSLLPIGMFWFGWTSFPSQHWVLPTCAVGVVTIGIFSIYLAVFNYFADTYHRYASSALAAQSFCRNMLAGFFPLITDAMYHRMTFQGASSFLGGVGLMLSVVPWVLVFYGDNIRRRSKFAREIMDP